MNILQVNKLKKSYITREIFNNVSFSIAAGQKVGLVGPNGTGKSTLMRCIAGLEEYDSGNIIFAKETTQGYLEQQVVLKEDETLFEVIHSAFADVLALYNEIRQLENAISHADAYESEALLSLYQEKQNRFENMNGYEVESRVRGIAIGLGFSESDFDRKIASFSGGERTRIMLARLLARNPDLLLLDEPTNHLDIVSIEWLEGFLKNYKGAVLVISHDEYFLDAVVDAVLDLDHQDLTVYPMGFFKYKSERAARAAINHKHFIEQQKHIAKEREYIERNRAGVNSKQARGREKRLTKEVLLKDTMVDDHMALADYQVKESARFVLRVEEMNVSIGGKELIHDVNFDIQQGEKVALIGRNGAGKTTLVKMVIDGIENGNHHVQLGNRVEYAYFDQHQSLLNDENTVLDELLSHCDLLLSQAKTLLARYLFTEDDLERLVGKLSGGEKVRLTLAILLYFEPNFLIMDEPTNHLDIDSKDIVIQFLKEFSGSIFVVSHDRELLNEVTTRTLELAEKHITSYPGNYAYYKDKKAMLAELAAAEKKPIEKKSTPATPKRKGSGISKSKLKDKIAKLEADIEQTEDQIDKLKADLSSPDANYSAIAEELEKQEAHLETTMEEWQEASEQLEEVMALA
jgi:ATP-binding cassette subfamily F protein 3